jgi:pyruvate kinase
MTTRPRAYETFAVPRPGTRRDFAELLGEVERLRAALAQAEQEQAAVLDVLDPAARASARNLVHYLALRQRDIRGLQQRLVAVGLTSLGRTEAHVMPSLVALSSALARMSAAGAEPDVPAVPTVDGRALLETRTTMLLGSRRASRRVRILVTMPSEAASDPALIDHLMGAGMDAARINCAHDDEDAWLAMIQNIRRAESKFRTRCRVLMDLGGPKIRTGPLGPGAQVVKVRPVRDEFGRTIALGRVRLVGGGGGGDDAGAAGSIEPGVRVDRAFLAALRAGDDVEITDLRHRDRTLRVASVDATGAVLETERTVYLAPRLVFRCSARHVSSPIIDTPQIERPLLLSRGDELLIRKDTQPAQQRSEMRGGASVRVGEIGCTLPAALESVMPGHRVWLDDGKVGGVVRDVSAVGVRIDVTDAPPPGEPPAKLRADKGINFPDTNVRVDALADKDRQDLRFIARHADAAGLSFVQRAQDVEDLLRAVEDQGPRRIGVVLKIETARAFRNLPALLLAALKAPAAGVMIARGDLAVEMGYERLAEVQEEILWLCEAAHVPVIWATQVLETLAKTGRPTRAEVTDAAMGERAECVMLNKGPYVARAVSTLDEILRRMERHQFKRSPLLRPLKVAGAPDV